MLRLTFHPYQKRFHRVLKTHHGTWSVREGILIQLEDGQGKRGQGEIAPLPWFGSETLEAALYFCRQLPTYFPVDEVEQIPPTLPACQFGFGSALEALLNNMQQRTPVDQVSETKGNKTLNYSALLPTTEAALTEWEILWKQGYQTFKLKIGIDNGAPERELCQALLQQLPPSAKLRLDANGGLDHQSVQQWLEMCDSAETSLKIEYLEQPLPPQQFGDMLSLSERYTTPIALDESVATLDQLMGCYQRGWRSIFVIKPAIAGYPQQLRQFCQTHAIDSVFSSVFETEVGRQVCLKLAQDLSTRAVGFGVKHWFAP